MTTLPIDEFGLIRRVATRHQGIDDGVIVAAVRRGDLIRLAPGIWVEARDDLVGPAAAGELFRLRSVAVLTSERDRGLGVLSHESAAAMLHLDTLHPSRDRVHVTRPGRSGGFVRGDRHMHVAAITADDVAVIDGIPVTRPERTAVDLAMAGDFDQAVVVFDSALAQGADHSLMTHILDGCGGRRGVGTARRALGVADGRTESVGESWSRAQIFTAGLPAPRLQHTFWTSAGEARADFDWAGRIVGEFDGMVKYGRLLRDGEQPRDALIREKRREDALRAMGIMVIRWTWTTLERRELAALLRPWLTRLAA